MKIETFQEQIEREIGKKLKLKINNNRSTMLSVKWEPGCTRVSMHRFFLQAPKNVMDSLACYISRKDKQMAPHVKFFIEENIRKLDYSQTIDPEKLDYVGNVYNLREMMGQLNQSYFNNKLDLNITWYGNRRRRNRSQITFGLYQDPLKLVKIHRLLDNQRIPDYVVSFVIYHEMLHHVCPGYTDKNGRNRIHTREFKNLEKRFHAFSQAEKWIKKNVDRLFARID